MKFKLFSEDFADGIEVDWPTVPRTGELVSINYAAATTNQLVSRVEYHADKDLGLAGIEVHLTF